jgi:hypothetical protein
MAKRAEKAKAKAKAAEEKAAAREAAMKARKEQKEQAKIKAAASKQPRSHQARHPTNPLPRRAVLVWKWYQVWKCLAGQEQSLQQGLHELHKIITK